MQKIKLLLRFGSGLLKLVPGLIALYLILSLISTVAIPRALPLLLQQLTNQAAPPAGSAAQAGPTAAHGGVVPTYVYWLVLTFALIPARMLCKLAQTKMDNRMETRLRIDLFDKAIRQTPEFFHRYNPAQLTNILTGTTIEAQQAVRLLLVDPLLSVVGICLSAFLISQQLKGIEGGKWIVAAMVLIGVLSVSLVQTKGQRPVYQSQMDLQKQRFAISGLVDSAVKSPEEIQAMDAEALFSTRHASALEVLMKYKRRIALTMESVNSAIGLPGDVITAVLLGMIVFQVSATNVGIKPGTLVALLLLIPTLMEPLKVLSAIGITASSSWPAVELVSKLMDEENRIKDLKGSRAIERPEPTLQAEHLDFRYAPQLNKVFDNLTLNVPPGKVTSLCARMGQGKTTFFRLAMRFYEPEQGKILLGGIPATEFTLKSLRQHTVMMSQFPAFFHDSVRDNFRIAKPEATDEEILNLCETTGLLPLLQRAIGPNFLDQNFAGGGLLSGGQKRLFALTRCLLRNPTFLFLDEPTTNMDNTEKYQLIPMMRAACKGRTVVVVDHDIPWLLQFSDYFLILDNGRIVQEGTGEQLLHQPGLLKELYTLALPMFEQNPAAPAGLAKA
jgi:ATP-binding cassette, subfamily B, bacterial